MIKRFLCKLFHLVPAEQYQWLSESHRQERERNHRLCADGELAMRQLAQVRDENTVLRSEMADLQFRWNLRDESFQKIQELMDRLQSGSENIQ